MASRAVVRGDMEVNPLENVRIVTKKKPNASPGNVVVRLKLRPVHPTDTGIPLRLFKQFEGREIVLGSEGLGHVEEIGDGVTKFKVGQRVLPTFFKQFYGNGNGSWQDYVELSEDEVFPVADSIPDEIAAQAIVNPWTVYGLIKDQDVPKGEYLLQGAAASVLGRMVIQLAKHWGIKTINIVRRNDVREELQKLGADEVINSKSEDVLQRVLEITGGKGAYGALDPIGGLQTKTIVSSVRDGGQVFIYGILGTKDYDATVGLFDFTRVHIKWWGLDQWLTPDKIQELASAVSKLLEDKVIVPLTGVTFNLSDIKAALTEAERPSRGGKVFLAS